MLDWISAVCTVGFCVALTIPMVRFLWFMANRDPDDPAVAQWEREHRAMSRRDRRHIRQAIAHGQSVAETRLAEAAEKGAQIVRIFRQECLAATYFLWWACIAGLLSTGAAMAHTLRYSGVAGWIWIGICALLALLSGVRGSIRLLSRGPARRPASTTNSRRQQKPTS